MKSAIILAAEPGLNPLGLDGKLEENASFIAGLGFDGAELTALNVDQLDTRKIKDIMRTHKLAIAALAAGRYYRAHGLSLSTGNGEMRNKTIEAVKKSVVVCAELGTFFVIGGAQGKFAGKREEGLGYLRDSLQECAREAEKEGTLIYLEATNRYLSSMIRTVEEGMRMIDEVGSPALKLLADTHHMNIEEKSIAGAIRQAKGYLGHVHFSDSNRLAPGQGHIDYAEVAEALRDIGYQGFVSAEIMIGPDQRTAARQTIELIKSLPY